MESESSSVKIEKLDNSNYYAWKQKILLLLSLRDVDDHIDSERPEDDDQIEAWRKKDKKAKALIGLSVSDQILEHIRHVDSAAGMWTAIKNIFERHTLLNKLSARRKFYTATKSEEETVLQFSNRIRQLASTLKSMNVTIEDNEMAMALLNGLPDPFDPLISALDAIGNEGDDLEFDHVKSRVMQEEQRIGMRVAQASAKSETNALMSKCQHSGCVQCNLAQNNRPSCDHCGKLGHTVDKCWKKHPELNPHKKKIISSAPAFMVNQDEDDPNVICLVGENTRNQNISGEKKWFIDSGCSNHMTFDKSLFETWNVPPVSEVVLGNGSKATITGCGTIRINIISDGKSVPCLLKNVLLVPELGYQLLSVSNLSKNGLVTSFKAGRCWIEKDEKVVASGTLRGTLYQLDVPETNQPVSEAFIASTLQVWHERMAHVDPSAISKMVSKNIVNGIEIKKSSDDNLKCDGCVLGKAHRSNIPKLSSSRSLQILELVHSDLNGPLDRPSLGGSRYFITFVDDYSRWTVVYMMRKKSESLKYFKVYHKYAEVHTRRSLGKVNFIHRSTKTLEEIKAIRTDNGGEYISNNFKEYLLLHGISHQLTVSYTPHQNGVAERMNRTLIDLVRSMLLTAGVSKSFWAEALETAVYIRNRVISRSLPSDKTPYHLWMGSVPDLSHLRIFGSNCFYTVPRKLIKKLDPRARPAMFVGYSTQSKGYKVYDLESRKMIVSRDVTFREPAKDKQGNNDTAEARSNPGGDSSVRFEDLSSSESEMELFQDSEPAPMNNLDNTSTHNNSGEDSEGDFDEAPTPKSLRRSFRKFTKTKPFWQKYSSLSATALSAQIVPLSYKAATTPENIDFWSPGIDREHDSLVRNETWSVVDRKPGMHVLPCKYVFRVKNGLPKARMVVLGCQQIFGLDYYHTFAPVVKFTTIRILLGMVAAFDLECEQMDVVTAFLNGDLEENIFMNIPEGLRTVQNEGKVCKLNKALYGLKQAPRQWYRKIHDYLVEVLKFSGSMNDPCLYIKKTTSKILIIALYVDDLLIIGNCEKEIIRIKEEFKTRFEMKDLGAVEIILGMQITRDRPNRRLHVSQNEYLEHVLERFGMAESKPVSTPIERALAKVPIESDEKLEPNIPYRQAVGSLIYLVTGTRPDIAFAVSQVSKFLESPHNVHWAGVKRIMRYLAGTRTHGIQFDGKKGTDITGYSDSDYAGCADERKSTGGYVFLLAGGSVSWKSKKQTVTATSTCEAEYMACCTASKEAVWLSRLLSDICTEKSPSAITIGIDNNGTIDLSTNHAINERSKHIDVQYHYVRECVKLGKIKLMHVSTADQLADPLTKALNRVKHERFRELQGIHQLE